MTFSISVVIPTHNRTDSLIRAVNSVLDQTFQPSEIIVVDDVCSDTCKELIDSLNSPIVRYVQNRSPGASSSRNLGVSLATGNYVAFLDDDDIWLADKLKRQYDQIISGDLDACFCRMMIEYENTRISYSTRSRNIPDAKKEILLNNFIGGTISSVIRRDLFLAIGGFDTDFPAREEYDLWIRLIHEGAKIRIVEEPLVIAYRSLNRRHRVSQNIDNYIVANKKILNKHSDKFSTFIGDEGYHLVKSNYSLFLAAQAASINLRGTTVYYYADALRFKFSLKTLIMLIAGAFSPLFLIRLRSMLS